MAQKSKGPRNDDQLADIRPALVDSFHNAVQAGMGRIQASVQTDAPKLSLTSSARVLLFLLWNQGRPVFTTELARRTTLSIGWISRIIDDLVGAELVTREPNEDDRRSAQLRITQKGQEVAGRLWAQLEPPFVAALIDLSPENRLIVKRFLQRATIELRKRLLLESGATSPFG